jgi:hypothetical protein
VWTLSVCRKCQVVQQIDDTIMDDIMEVETKLSFDGQDGKYVEAKQTNYISACRKDETAKDDNNY